MTHFVRYATTKLHWDEWYEVRFTICEESNTMYVTSIVAMMGCEGRPYDDILEGFDEIDKYAEDDRVTCHEN